jgi:hypothetical protein
VKIVLVPVSAEHVVVRRTVVGTVHATQKV